MIGIGIILGKHRSLENVMIWIFYTKINSQKPRKSIMFRSTFRLGRNILSAATRSSRSFQIGSFLTFGLVCSEVQKQRIVRNVTKPVDKDIIVENDAIYLNKNTYMEKLLGNKRENYILIVYGEENDEDTRASIRTAKHIKQALRSSGLSLNVYVVSRPTIENVRKIANRILDFPVFEKEGDAKQVEVYFKTIHSTDYVYFKWRRESFFTPFKTNKFVKKIARYESLFHSITISNEGTEKQLAELLQRQYIRLDEPVILKCSLPPTSSSSAQQKKIHAKSIKSFKKLCFFSAERKLIPLKSQFIILESKDLMKSLNLEDGQVYILRNDILQKLQSSNQIQGESQNEPTKLIIDDSFLYIPNKRNANGINDKLNFFSSKLESFDNFKKSNAQLLKSIDTLSREQGSAQSGEELEEMKDQATFINFIMPRITFLRDSKFGNIGKLFKKITFAKEKRVLSLNLTASDKQKNHSRLVTLKKLHEQYHREFTFLLVDSDSQIVDLFPHLDIDQPQFSLFNFFNIDKSALNKVSKYYKHLIFPFEKYFLEDTENLYEDYDRLSRKIDSILIDDATPKDYVINQTDMIPKISSSILDQLVNTSTFPFLVQVLNEDIDCQVSSESLDANQLARLTLNKYQLDLMKSGINGDNNNQNPIKGIFRMSHLNQHYFLNGAPIQSDGMPIYLFIDPKQKRVIVSQSKEGSSKLKSYEELKNFLKICSQPSSSISAIISGSQEVNSVSVESQVDNLTKEPIISDNKSMNQETSQSQLEIQKVQVFEVEQDNLNGSENSQSEDITFTSLESFPQSDESIETPSQNDLSSIPQINEKVD